MSQSKNTKPSGSLTMKKPAASANHSSRPNVSDPKTSTSRNQSSKPSVPTSKPAVSLLKTAVKASAAGHSSKPSVSTLKPSTSTSHASGSSTRTQVPSLKDEAASFQKLILDGYNEQRTQLENFYKNGKAYIDNGISATNRQYGIMRSVMKYMDEGTAIRVVKLLMIHRKAIMKFHGERNSALKEMRETGKTTWKPALEITAPSGTQIKLDKLEEVVKELAKAGLFESTENPEKLKSVAKKVVEFLTEKKLI